MVKRAPVWVNSAATSVEHAERSGLSRRYNSCVRGRRRVWSCRAIGIRASPGRGLRSRRRQWPAGGAPGTHCTRSATTQRGTSAPPRLPGRWATNVRRWSRLLPSDDAHRGCTTCAVISLDAETGVLAPSALARQRPIGRGAVANRAIGVSLTGSQGFSQQAFQGEPIIATQLQFRAIEQHDCEFPLRQRPQFPHALDVDQRRAMDAHKT